MSECEPLNRRGTRSYIAKDVSDKTHLLSHPPSDSNKFLQQKFYEEFVSQSVRLDDVAKQLFTLEFSVLSVYVTLLKFAGDGKAHISVNTSMIVTLIFWVLALICTLFTLLPTKVYEVEPSLIRDELIDNVSDESKRKKSIFHTVTMFLRSYRNFKNNQQNVLSIESFFLKRTQDKYNKLVLASSFFLISLVSVIFTL